ncbi:MAG: succinate dehydrogenase cytochrome b subunit [Bacteroidia bacterium]
MSKENLLQSSIGRKFVMGLTGLFLISFLIVHVSINACIFFNDGGTTFNTAADFMAHNIIVRIMEVGLFAGLIIHIVQAYALTIRNNKARPVKYVANNGGANSTWYSRSMALLGTLLLMFLVVHLGNFWIPTKIAVYSNEAHDTFSGMKAVFSQWYLVAIYVIGNISLAYHLLHGFQSAFQTLGMNHRKYTPLIKKAGIAFSIIVPLIFAAMPISMFMGWIR